MNEGKKKKDCILGFSGYTCKKIRVNENHSKGKHKERDRDIKETKVEGKEKFTGKLEKRAKCPRALLRSPIYYTDFSWKKN